MLDNMLFIMLWYFGYFYLFRLYMIYVLIKYMIYFKVVKVRYEIWKL